MIIIIHDASATRLSPDLEDVVVGPRAVSSDLIDEVTAYSVEQSEYQVINLLDVTHQLT